MSRQCVRNRVWGLLGAGLVAGLAACGRPGGPARLNGRPNVSGGRVTQHADGRLEARDVTGARGSFTLIGSPGMWKDPVVTIRYQNRTFLRRVVARPEDQDPVFQILRLPVYASARAADPADRTAFRDEQARVARFLDNLHQPSVQQELLRWLARQLPSVALSRDRWLDDVRKHLAQLDRLPESARTERIRLTSRVQARVGEVLFLLNLKLAGEWDPQREERIRSLFARLDRRRVRRSADADGAPGARCERAQGTRSPAQAGARPAPRAPQAGPRRQAGARGQRRPAGRGGRPDEPDPGGVPGRIRQRLIAGPLFGRSPAGSARAARGACGFAEFLIEAAGGVRALAELLGALPSQPARWRRGAQPSPEFAQQIVDLDHLMASLLQVWEPATALDWLRTPNGHLDGALPLDVLRLRGSQDVVTALRAEAEGAYV